MDRKTWKVRRWREVHRKIGHGGPLDCWPWLGRLDQYGYGLYGNRGAHRVVYELQVGPIPDGLQLDHLCRNRSCVNPSHLEPVTVGENIRRGHISRGTARTGAWAERKREINRKWYENKKKRKAEWHSVHADIIEKETA